MLSINRVAWAVLILVAMTTFFWFVGSRLVALEKHQTTVNVEVIYNESLPFPSVTICNQNLFRSVDVKNAPDYLYGTFGCKVVYGVGCTCTWVAARVT